MYLTPEKKAELFEKHGAQHDAKDTGSAESQIALFTFRIAHLTAHMQQNHKDVGTKRALLALVGKRRRLLDYLKKRDIERYRAVLKDLELRK
ncbi:MAG TPA: 30S ribosomal protein S15 [Bacteroidales bacterium]|nr:30S ribosomal protein S15 [Bacteroidales bacterium]